MSEPLPRRVRIVGTSGSGKSHLAVQLAEILDLPRLDLDAVFWDAGWVHRDLDEAHALVHAFVAAHPGGWVADGDWTRRLQGLLDPGTPGGADVFALLDHPRRTVMRRVIARTLRRSIRREELWHGNRERVREWLLWDPERNIIRWAWTSHRRVRARMLQRISDGAPVVRLSGQREVDAWLSSLSANRRSVEP